MNDDRKQFRSSLRRIRQQRGLTQAELSERSGVASAVISFYEVGTRIPGLENIKDLCRGLECTATDLLDV